MKDVLETVTLQATIPIIAAHFPNRPTEVFLPTNMAVV